MVLGKETFNEMELSKEKVKINEWIIEYAKWLIQFIQDKDVFFDDNWDYSDEKLNDIDKKMVDKLSLFFESINLYAQNNYIYSAFRPLGECYKIKINNNEFEIGYIAGQGTSFYCKKIELDDEKKFIDFIDIINNNKQNNVEYIDDSLNNLSNVLMDLYNNGIPIEAIIKTFNLFVHHIESVEREKNKVKKKVL